MIQTTKIQVQILKKWKRKTEEVFQSFVQNTEQVILNSKETLEIGWRGCCLGSAGVVGAAVGKWLNWGKNRKQLKYLVWHFSYAPLHESIFQKENKEYKKNT